MKCFSSLLRSAVAGLALVVVVSAVSAQDEGGRRGRGGFGGGGFGGGMDATFLLRMEQVQKEIELQDEQKEEINAILESARPGRGDFQNLSEEERRERFREMREQAGARRAEMQAKVDEVLLDFQKERLKEISLQVRGNVALADEEVQKELGISEEQKEKLGQVREGMQEKFREVFAGMREEGGREAAREKMTALQKEVNDQTLAVLTEEQKSKLEQMKGKPFELDRSQFRGGFGGRRGGPGGEGGERRRRPGGDN